MDEKIIESLMGSNDQIQQAMKSAIQEACKGGPYVSPNPRVGCAVLDSAGRLISVGYHQKYGEAHAEVNAIKNLQAQLKLSHPDFSEEDLKKALNQTLTEATVIVTLEPCAHQGKTPSCAKYLATLPIKKVIFGLVDPNPLVAGQGAEILRQAGKEVLEYQGPLKSELYDVCEIFLKNFTQKKVFVAAKVATSLDGFIGLKSGESQWITGPEARLQSHALRAEFDATLVGRKTIQTDNPRLDIRHPEIKKDNKIIILDSSAQILQGELKENIFSAHAAKNIYFAVSAATFEFLKKSETIESLNKKAQAARLVDFSVSDLLANLLVFSDLENLLKAAWDKGIRSVYVEGGSKTLSSFFQADLVDRLYLFMAPSLIGAVQGKSWTESLLTTVLAEKKQLKDLKVQSFGQDILITAKI